MLKQICLMMAAAALISGVQGIPLSFAQAMNNAGQKDSSSAASVTGGLEASINSNVIGKAHIAWQSIDPIGSSMGRHKLLGRSVEDLTGVFSIEKFIQLWSDSPPGEISVDWLPCS